MDPFRASFLHSPAQEHHRSIDIFAAPLPLLTAFRLLCRLWPLAFGPPLHFLLFSQGDPSFTHILHAACQGTDLAAIARDWGKYPSLSFSFQT
mmetsp:Transcript_44138/g.66709  ORF Transcript_44138/g.66709 Transcript_44138/m.66709 type:complete len:93 (-) Transcript_44138:23-301(-)